MRTNMARQVRRAFIAAVTLACVFAAPVEAVEVQSLSNPVPNGAIVIDGNLSDWAGVTPFQQDTIGDGSTGAARPLDIDILQGAVAHDANFIYVLYRNAGDNMIDPASNWIFFDLDRNQATGQNGIAGMNSIGMEFNLGGTGGWNAWNSVGGAFAGGANGRTVATGDSSAIPAGADFLEYAISRTAAQPNGLTFNPIGGTSFNLVFGAEDSVLDTSPNDGSQNWFNYNVVPEPAAGTLSVVAAAALGGWRRRRS